MQSPSPVVRSDLGERHGHFAEGGRVQGAVGPTTTGASIEGPGTPGRLRLPLKRAGAPPRTMGRPTAVRSRAGSWRGPSGPRGGGRGRTRGGYRPRSAGPRWISPRGSPSGSPRDGRPSNVQVGAPRRPRALPYRGSEPPPLRGRFRRAPRGTRSFRPPAGPSSRAGRRAPPYTGSTSIHPSMAVRPGCPGPCATPFPLTPGWPDPSEGRAPS